MGEVPFKVGIASEGKAFRLGIEKDVIDPLEDAEGQLKDFAKSGDRAGDDIEAALRGAQKETDRTRDDIEELGRKIEQAGRKGEGLKDGFRRGADGAGEAVDEFKDEAVSNLSETVSSFRGDAEDIAQIAQDTLGGVIANLGPAGLVAGTAGAVGIGLIMGAIEETAAAEERFREQVGELAAELIELGGDPAAVFEHITENMRELASATGEGEMSLADLRGAAERSASGFDKLSRAFAGDADGLDEIIEKEQEALDAMDNRASRKSEKNREMIGQQRAIVDGLEKQREVIEAAAAEEAAFLVAGGPGRQARIDWLDAIQGELDESLGAWSEYVDAETGAIDPAKYIDAMRARREGIENFTQNVKTLASQFGLSFEEQQAILDQGLDFAPHLQTIMDSGHSSAYIAEMQRGVDGAQAVLDGADSTITVTASADTSTAAADIDQAAAGREASIEATATTAPAAAQIDQAAAKPRTAQIVARASTAQAEAALARLVRARTVTVTAATQLYGAEQALTHLVRPRTVPITADIRDREGKAIPTP